MFDFRLKVFHTVAKRLNFTKAAEELFITQPAVTKHIHEIESYFKTQLFHRNGTKISLTTAGSVLLKHTDILFGVYRELESDMAAVNQDIGGTMRIGASTTVAQYIIPGHLASFKKRYRDITVELSTGNTEHIELLLIANKIDFGIIEGQSKRKELKYSKYLKDELVLCTRYGNPLIKKGMFTLNDLYKLSFVFREQGSGSLEVINAALKKAGIKISQLQKEMILESSESIKSYLISSDSFAFLSIHAVLNELTNKQISVVDIKNFSIERFFYVVRQLGENNSLINLFIKKLNSDNLK